MAVNYIITVPLPTNAIESYTKKIILDVSATLTITTGVDTQTISGPYTGDVTITPTLVRFDSGLP